MQDRYVIKVRYFDMKKEKYVIVTRDIFNRDIKAIMSQLESTVAVLKDYGVDFTTQIEKL